MEENKTRSPLQITFARYLLATVVGVAANLTLYLVLARRVGVYEPLANLAAASAVIGPRFCAHKLWVWRHRTTKRIGLEAGVHVGLTVAGLALSTALAAVLASRDAGAVQLAVGNVGAFGVVWCIRFYVSHVHLFVPSRDSEGREGRTELLLESAGHRMRK